jgi:regulator of protease activity HflC (stomatin/prohibitin superfamily)
MKGLAERPASIERPARTISGAPILALNVATCVAVPFILWDGARMGEWYSVLGGLIVLVGMILMWKGFITAGPNESWVVVSWGDYRGTVREPGLHWVNPFAEKTPVTLKARSLCVDRLKVHDKQGAPIELAATIVWRVVETARAVFDVHNVEDFVRVQCDSAVRHLASNICKPLDGHNAALMRRGVGELQANLKSSLQERVMRAGVTIDEIRLTQRCEKWAPIRATSMEAA